MANENLSEKSTIGAFMKLGQPEKPTGVNPEIEQEVSSRGEEANKEDQTTLPPPIPGTEFGSERERWNKLKKEGQLPESALSMADIVNLKGSGNGEEEEPWSVDLMRLLQMGGRGATNITGEFGKSLEGLAKNREPESIEEVRGLYTEMLNENLREIFDLYEKNVIRDEKNAYPYDYRQAEFLIANVSQAVGTLERTDWVKESADSRVFLAELKQDVAWLESFLQTSVAQTASLPYKFDVILQLQLLKESRYRAFVTNDDMEGMMSAQIPGLQLSPEQSDFKKNKKIGLEIPQKYTEHGFGEVANSKESMSLREIAVKMFAASFKLRMNLAAVSQVDLIDLPENYEKATFKGNHLTKEEIFFYKDLFWWKDPVGTKECILSPYITARGEDVRRITALLEASLETNAYFRLKEIVGTTENLDKKIELVSEITKDVKALALKKENDWGNRQNENIITMLSALITQQGFMQDFSYGHSSRYCWEYSWEENGEGKVERSVELGPIASPSGDFPSLGFAQRKHTYDKLGNSCTKFLLPTVSAGRKEVSKYPPYEMPPFKIENTEDEFLREQWNFLFSDEPKYVKEREEMGYKPLHPKVAEQLKKWAFKWVTPYTSNYLGGYDERTSDEKYNLEVPHLMPSSLDNIANFFDIITAERKKLPFGAKSVWQELIEGKETYEIDWGKLDTQAHSKWMIDLDMASRYMKVLIEPVDEEKDPILGLFWHGPGTFPPKELAKRLRLSMRDSDDAPPTVHEIAMIPFFVVMACAEKYGISGAYGWSKTTKEDKETNTSNADRFFVEMAYWKRALRWLPGDRPPLDKFKDKEGNPTFDYGNAMALVAEFYETVISRVMKASSEESFYQAKKNLEKTASRINKLGHLNKGAFPYSVGKEKALQK